MILKNKLTRETLEILKMITQWNTISTSNYNGTSITLEILIGILRKFRAFTQD